jgi:purine-binding chemotaxis protein CheW
MVDLAKIRKKAKERGAPRPSAAAAEGGGPPQSPDEKLQKFLERAGKQRFPEEPLPPKSTDEVELLTFILGAERYAIDLDDVVEIAETRRATRVPNAAPNTVGIFSLRGSIITLLDIRSKLKQPPANGKDPRIIVVRDGASCAGFEVDRVLRPARFERTSIEPQPVVDRAEESEFIRGVVRTEDALTIVLDLSKLLT